MSDLDNLLNDLESEVKATQEEIDAIPEEASVTEPEPEVKDEKATVAEDVAVEEDSPSESEVEDKSIKVPLKALEEERHKRQELERQMEALKAQPKQPETPEEPVDFYADPEKALGDVQSSLQQQMLAQKIQMSEIMVQAQHDDYQQMLDRFQVEAGTNPALLDAIKSHAHPAMYVYETGKKFAQMDEIDNLDAYKESLSDKLRKEIEEELKAKYEGKQTKAKALPSNTLSEAGTSTTDSTSKVVDVDDFLNKSF